MSYSIEHCVAGRKLEITTIYHGEAATDVVVKFADGKEPVSPDGSDASPGVIGAYTWQRSWSDKARVYDSLLTQASRCSRCLGQPDSRPCDINETNVNDRCPQPLPASGPTTASSS